MQQELDIAIKAAKAGGQVVADYFKQIVEVRIKENDSRSYNLVTDADLESEKAVAEVIKAAFPTHEILGEESNSGDIKAEHLWIVDPLDGTNNFAHKIDHFTCCVAYAHRGVVKVGAIYNPISKDLYHATLAGGAYRNGERVSVTTAATLDRALIGTGFYYDRGQMMESTLDALRDLFRQNIHGMRRMGAASLDLCYVGCGLFDAYFEYALEPWDFAAGALFVCEAGGQVSNCRGEPLTLEKSSLLASNSLLHQQMLATTIKHHP